MNDATTVKQESDREVIVTRTIQGPVRLVFQAWTRADLFRQWWVPKSSGATLLSCEMDVRVGGKYRLTFKTPGPEPMAFFGTYLEVVPNARITWTNDEGGEAGHITKVTFEDLGEKTKVVFRERYPTQEAFEEAVAGMEPGMEETFDQLEAFMGTMRAGAAR